MCTYIYLDAYIANLPGPCRSLAFSFRRQKSHLYETSCVAFLRSGVLLSFSNTKRALANTHKRKYFVCAPIYNICIFVFASPLMTLGGYRSKVVKYFCIRMQTHMFQHTRLYRCLVFAPEFFPALKSCRTSLSLFTTTCMCVCSSLTRRHNTWRAHTLIQRFCQ